MATLTKEQYEALKRQGRGTYRGQTSSSGQYIIEADKFVGDLEGNADTATRLRDPITISLGGDAEGSAQFAGSSFRLDATIREAEHSVNADVAENAKHSAQASHADLANIATLALRSMLADNASHAEEASHADDSTHADSSDTSTLATRALHADDAYHADTADNATYALKDSNGDNIHNTFVDKQSQITTNTNNIATHEGTLTNHEGRILQAESNISSLDTRVGNIETSTDVGRITQRIVNIEAKDVEQDGRLDAINDTMVTLSTAQYILAPKTFNAGSKTIMDNEAGATEITNKEYVDNKVLSSANYVTNYTDNKVLSASRYMTDYVDNKVLSTAQYVDDNFMSLTKSQYVTGLNTYNTVLPQSNLTPTNDNDFITKKYFDENQSSGHALFDVVTKDHVLTYGKDLEGFAPLGTWVYKDAVDGSRYGYPDFVQTCLDEYDEATDDVIPCKKFEQPILSANGTLGGDSFAVQASSEYNSSYSAWKAFDGTTNGDSDAWIATGGTTAYIIFYNPKALYVKKLYICNRNDSGSTHYSIISGIVYGSNDNTNWQELKTFTNDVISSNANWFIDLTNNSNAYKYYKILGNSSAVNVSIGSLSIEAYEELLPIKRYTNGHIYFDVADIETVNTYFNTYGHAWFYGVDRANERVFLPRQAHGKLIESYKNGSDWYRIYEDGWCEQGEVKTDNVTSITYLIPFVDTSYYLAKEMNYDGTNVPYFADISFYNLTTTGATTRDGTGSSNPNYRWYACGYCDITDLQASPIYEYMVVGNVKVEQASTDVIDVTTTNNDTVPLFTAHYFDYTPNNLSWLKGGSQSNSGDLYKTCYNELVNVLNGETKYGALKVIDQADMVSGTDYSLYWIVNQTTQTFRTPTKTQQRFVVKTWKNGNDWYRIYNDRWCEQGGSTVGSADPSRRTVNLHKQFLDTSYSISVISTDVPNDWYTSTSDSSYRAITGVSGSRNKTTTSFDTGSAYAMSWQASGYIDLTNETFDTSLYFKVANAVENIQILNVGEVTEALTSKADTTLANASNVAQSFKDMSIGWGMPNYSAGVTYTLGTDLNATVDGFIIGNLRNSGASANITVTIQVNGVTIVSTVGTTAGGFSMPIFVPITKGNTYKISCTSGTDSFTNLIFYPCQGAN